MLEDGRFPMSSSPKALICVGTRTGFLIRSWTRLGQARLSLTELRKPGGYGLSVTELGDLEGMVVYRRQMPGGLVLIREEHRYRIVRIDGAPAAFRAKASDLLGNPVDIFFGEDTPVGLPESITILRDEDGQPAAAIAKRGNSFSFSVLNVATAFRTKAKLDLSGGQKGPKPVTVQNLALTLADDRNHVNLQLLNDGKVVGKSTLSAVEMDAVISGLGQFRSALNQQVRPEPDQAGVRRNFLWSIQLGALWNLHMQR